MITFEDFFFALWGKAPFPWQRRLAERVASQGWPPEIGLPTAAGKTALIDIAIHALAAGAPAAARRVFFVVDRRVIVDDAARRAEQIARQLRDAAPGTPLYEAAQALREKGGAPDPLQTGVLRGGIPRDTSWTDSPLQPLVVCSTLDQVGSSLLFRSYGSRNEYGWPIAAGLAANDALIILDEAHTSAPFAETLAWMRKYRTWAEAPLATPWSVVEMSATPRGQGAFRESPEDAEHPELKRRWQAAKRARLTLVDAREGEQAAAGGFTAVCEGLVREAGMLCDEQGARVIGVIANRVATAREAYRMLRTRPGCEAVLLVGRARAFDRDRLWEEWRGRIGLDRDAEPEVPVFVVATQSIEVGANLDFDGLVTEMASLDALEQRFGRLDRAGKRGTSAAAIVAQRDQIKSGYVDPIYDAAIGETWRWLESRQQKVERLVPVGVKGARNPRLRKVKEQYVDLGVLALREALAAAGGPLALRMPPRRAPVLLPAHLDLLAQTSPPPAASPEPALYLHGPETSPADVQIVWRSDLVEGEEGLWVEIAALCPPSAAEAVGLPVWAVRKWLGGGTSARADRGSEGLADVDGLPAPEEAASGRIRPVLRWSSADDAEVLHTAEAVRPGMTLVAPSSYGGCDPFGWDPACLAQVEDVGDPVKLLLGRPMLRLHRELARQWNYEPLAAELRKVVTEAEAREVLERWQDQPAPAWMAGLVRALLASRRLQLLAWPGGNGATEAGEAAVETAAICAKGGFEQESGQSSFTREVRLEEHLAGCRDWAARFAGELRPEVRRAVIAAAEVHDLGKSDPRFQAWLRGGLPLKPGELLAKSRRAGQNWRAIRRAREQAGYPEGGRHELLSVALLESDPSAFPEADFDLLLHLVGSHHGRCRPFAPFVPDTDPRRVTYGGWSAALDHGLHRLDSGVCERFWRLTRRYGWWGLAYLEALVRLADCTQSELEEEIR